MFSIRKSRFIAPTPISENQRQGTVTLTSIMGVITGLMTVGFITVYSLKAGYQIGILAILFALPTLVSIFAVRWLYPRRFYELGMAILSITFALAMLGIAGLLSGMGLASAVVFLIYSLIVSSFGSHETINNITIGIGILISSACALLTDYSPFQQVSNELIAIVTPAMLGVLFMLYIAMMVMQFISASLRTRLVTSFLAIVIIPLIFLSTVQSGFLFSLLTQDSNQAIKQAADQTAFGLDSFLTNTQKSIIEAAKSEVFAQYFQIPPELRDGSPVEKEMKVTLRVLDNNTQNNTIYLSSYALLDIDGKNVYDTLRDRLATRFSSSAMQSIGLDLLDSLSGEGSSEAAQDYFSIPARSGVPYMSQVQVNSSTRGFFYISAPVKDPKGQTVGVLRVRYDGQILQDLLKNYTSLVGARSYPILLDENNIRLADAYTPNNIYRAIAPLSQDNIRVLKQNQRLPDVPESLLATNYVTFNQQINNFEKEPVFTTELQGWADDSAHVDLVGTSLMRTRPWKVVYLRTDFSIEELRRNQRRLTTQVTTIIAALVAIIAVVMTRVLSRPITQLTRTAQRISEGDLEAQSDVHSKDEFGLLGSAFNTMTNQLRTFIAELEDRVKDRTREVEKQNLVLANRARQLQTISNVARQIVSSQELDALLSSITQQVSEQFDFYHVGIFLLDQDGRYAALRAANSEGGLRMLARHHQLQVGKVGIVGYVTGTGEPRIATDVGEDAVFFNNPDLPETRSEMALPLKVSDRIIGALDIQSTRSNDFQQEDIELFTVLADQVAIALHNNLLYTTTAEALEEAQSLHRQYLRSEWDADTSKRKSLGYLYNQSGVTPQNTENPLWKKVFHSGEPVYAVLPSSEDAQNKMVMAVPIAIRGETIGVIHVQDQVEGRMWSEDEISMVNSIANQVAVALENARLFESTIRRADRERKVLQITAKIRSTNDPQEMMQIAVHELQEALHATRAQIYVRDGQGGPEDLIPENNHGPHLP